jgi:murein DD-endopeptidase MepM/ murein hydrolase activator NlpD
MTGLGRAASGQVLRWLLPLLMVATLPACDIYREDDEVGNADVQPPPVQEAALGPALQPLQEAGGSTLTVRPGQTLYAVSRQTGVPLRALIDANNLAPPFLLKAGQTLHIPRVRTYTVVAGDNLYGIARRTGVEAATLTRLNHLQPPYVVAAGTVLVLPTGAAGMPEPVQMASAPPPRSHASEGVAGGIVAEALPPPSAVASARAAPAPPRGNVPPAIDTEAVPIPEIPPDRPMAAPPQPPQPAAAPEAAAVPEETEPVAPPEAPAKPSKPPPAPVTVTPAAPPPQQAPAAPPKPQAAVIAPAKPATAPPAAPPVPTPPPAHVPPPEPESGVRPAAPATPGPEVAAIVSHHRAPSAPLFTWPVRGRVLSTYGEAAGGTHNDGINVAAPEGTEIDAAESGVVAYAGDELRGFGNLLLIKHADGWVTAYAHAKRLLVKKGDHVLRGQAIAEVGTSGGVDRPQVHFELRQGTKAIDPLDHLPSPGTEAN